MKHECVNCIHYFIEPENVTQGTCRFNPPSVFLVVTQKGPAYCSSFPTVKQDWTCGKFELKNEYKS